MDGLSLVSLSCPLISPGTEPAGSRDRTLSEQQIVLMDASHPDRARAETMVQEVFQRSYGAQLRSFYPFLLGIKGPDGEYRAIAGIRPGTQPLFAEHYLDGSAGELLGVARKSIVEVGNLATRRNGEIRWIIAAVTAFLHGAGFTRVLLTITPLLRNSFKRMGLPLKHLADARQECLPPAQAEGWGAYYDCGPQVCYGRIAIGYHAFRKRVDAQSSLRLAWENALRLGEVQGRRVREYKP